MNLDKERLIEIESKLNNPEISSNWENIELEFKNSDIEKLEELAKQYNTTVNTIVIYLLEETIKKENIDG